MKQTPTHPTHKGKLIVFEGIDGTGKSTQVQLLFSALKKQNTNVFSFKEPTEGKWGIEIRKFLLKSQELEQSSTHIPKQFSPQKEYELFFKDRKENYEKNIQNSLKKGIVILDRYYFSSMAYQGAKGVSVQKIQEQSEKEFPKPDLLFILELPLEKALKQIEKRKQGKDTDEKINEKIFDGLEKESYLKKVQRIYQTMDFPYMIRLCADLKPETLHKKIFSILNNSILKNL